MSLFYLLQAVVELGLPVAGLSWLLFYRLYSRGELDRDADHKTIRTSLRQIRKATKASPDHGGNLLHAKWMKFGGGFYGVAALWTLIVLEGGGLLNLILHPSSIEGMFKGGLVDFAVNWLVNQFTTIVQAFTWFSYWPRESGGFFGWIAVAYAGYLLGLNLARREAALVNRLVGFDWRARVRNYLTGDRSKE